MTAGGGGGGQSNPDNQGQRTTGQTHSAAGSESGLGTGFSGVACGSQEGGYEAGRLLVEQLIYQFGHEALISFTKAIVNTPGQDSEKWKVAFEKQFKISYDKWLENVVPEIEKREL